MSPIERTALAFTFIWTLFDAFAPGAPYHERMHFTLITTFGIGYLHGVHILWYRKVKGFFKPKRNCSPARCHPKRAPHAQREKNSKPARRGSGDPSGKFTLQSTKYLLNPLDTFF